MTPGHPGHPPATTVRGTLVPGPTLLPGAVRPYRALTTGPGEPHLVRGELTGGSVGEERLAPMTRRRALFAFAHVTDLQLADVQSPARYEFLDRHVDDPRYHGLVPMHRPQEALTARATQAMVETLNAVDRAPVSGADLALVVTTGDAIDNAQWNELRMFLALLEGGQVCPGSGGPRYEGVQSPAWGDRGYWRPDDPAGDDYQRDFGFPHLPALLEDALAAFESHGLRHPWLACFGNHEHLVQGVGAMTPALQQVLLGGRKTAASGAALDDEAVYQRFVDSPESFLGGTAHDVTADAERRAVGRRDFVEAHFSPLSRPVGHGFTDENRLAGTAYYAHDAGAVRIICLDTASVVGAGDGALDPTQARWLEQRLVEVSSRYLTPEGEVVRTGNADRLVVVISHHGPDTMTNLWPQDGGRPVAGPETLALLHRFANVVAWVNGHTHINRVVPRPDPSGPTGGFWEVTTSAIVDWPCQARLLEVIDNTDGTLSLVCTMVDHHGLVRPGADDTRTGAWLAGMHRELAGNEPWGGFGSARAGTLGDRNVELRLPAPFPLGGLPETR